jgi:hypothetical protein
MNIREQAQGSAGQAQGSVRKGTVNCEDRHMKERAQAQGSAEQALDRVRSCTGNCEAMHMEDLYVGLQEQPVRRPEQHLLAFFWSDKL